MVNIFYLNITLTILFYCLVKINHSHLSVRAIADMGRIL